MHGISPNVWSNMMTTYGVKSLLDVGCGRGLSTSWFQLHGADVLCVEGSHDAVERSVLPRESVVEHDFSRGPWWPEKTYDAAWAVVSQAIGVFAGTRGKRASSNQHSFRVHRSFLNTLVLTIISTMSPVSQLTVQLCCIS